MGHSDGRSGTNAEPAVPIVPGPHYSGTNRLAVMNLWWTQGPRLASTTTLSGYAHNAREYDASLVVVGVEPFERRLAVNDLAARQRIVFAPSSRQLLDGGVEVRRINGSWRMKEMKRLEFPRGLGPAHGAKSSTIHVGQSILA